MATIRGRVMAYDQATGKGIVGAENERYEFDLQSWKGSDVPSVGRTVEIFADGSATVFVPVSEGDIVKEKLEVVGKNLAVTGSNAAAEALARHGHVTLAAMAAFLVASLALNVVSVRAMGMSGGLSIYEFFSMSSGFGKFTLIVAWIALIVPLVWTDKRAYRALFVPLAPLAVLCWSLWDTYSTARQQMAGMSAFFGGEAASKMPSFFNIVNPGAGFYVLTVSAVALAFVAARRIKA